MKKIINVVLVLFLAVFSMVGLVACQDDKDQEVTIKIGMICLHDESSTYDKNFIESMYRALDELGLSKDNLELATEIPENSACKDKACELAATCDLVFADSFDHEDYMIQAAIENPDVNFCHATGVKAHTAGVKNFYNAFASIYEGRYLAGVAAGLKINEMIEKGTKINNVTVTAANAKIGYVGAWPYEEVVSGYTSFYLGAKSVCPTVTMDVRYTNSWYDETAEKNAANALIKGGCCLISQHADSYGAPNACEAAKVPNVSYNGSTFSKCPDTYLISSKINWTPYFKYIINQTMNNEEIATDWTGTIANGAVEIGELGTCAAKGTKEALDKVIAEFKAGTLHVFNINNFTVNGQKITSAKANVNYDIKYEADTEVVHDGYYDESAFRSAPYFGLRIDGIVEINEPIEEE